MKRVYVLALLALACQTKKTSTDVSQLMTPAPTKALISLDTASQIIADYLTQSRISLSQYTLGGVFPVSDFTPDASNEGVLMWYCFNASTKKIFMVVEPYTHYDTSKLPSQPIQPFLRQPENWFTYVGPAPTEKDVKTFLLNQKEIGASRALDNATAVRYVNSFDSLMNRTLDEGAQRYQKYPFNYFIWGADYKTFVTWPGTKGYVRYYLAYNEEHTPNRIRIVLMAADQDGNTITGKGISTNGSSSGQGLQNGWPPPPFN